MNSNPLVVSLFRTSVRRPGLCPREDYAGSAVYKMTLAHVFYQVLRSVSVTIIPSIVHTVLRLNTAPMRRTSGRNLATFTAVPLRSPGKHEKRIFTFFFFFAGLIIHFNCILLV